MALMIQYDLFEKEMTEYDKLWKMMEEIKESSDKVRKGIFARHQELCKLFLDLNERLEILEKKLNKNT